MSGFSSTNVLNSLSMHIASHVLFAGGLVYWGTTGALQISPTGWYLDLPANRTAILATPAVVAALATARAIVTIVDSYPTEPRFVTRLISETTIGNPNEVTVPALALSLPERLPVELYELGTTRRVRRQILMAEGATRTADEQRWLSDVLHRALEDYTVVPVLEHELGTLAQVGVVETGRTFVGVDTYLDAADVLTYQIVATTQVEYVE